MYVRGEIGCTIDELDDTLTDLQELAERLESFTEISCLHQAIDCLYDILESDITD